MFENRPFKKEVPKKETGDCEMQVKKSASGVKIKIGAGCKKEQVEMAKNYGDNQ